MTPRLWWCRDGRVGAAGACQDTATEKWVPCLASNSGPMLSIAFYSYMFWMIGYCDTSVHFEVVRTQGLQLVMSSWSFKHLCRLQVVCLILFCGTFCVALGAARYDCGVFTCFFADCFSAGKALTFEQEDMPTLRMRSAGRLFLPGSLTPMFTLQCGLIHLSMAAYHWQDRRTCLESRWEIWSHPLKDVWGPGWWYCCWWFV